MYVIGTAGHVDHGKSTLVEALTGIDPDRLKEEKEREMTIDLGFAWLNPGDGKEVIGIIDVPGHRDFIENMLAGVGGIDIALLVVAADEGVMPQTKEHLAIIDLLQVQGGLVALTKIDLIEDPDWLDLVMLDIAETLEGTVLSEADILPVSARTGQGIVELRETLIQTLSRIKARVDEGRPRLPIDRVFSLPGFGTIVTGTLLGGALKIGDSAEIQPSGKLGRIRGLQTHKTTLEIAHPGSRVAVNVSGIDKDDINRGEVLGKPNTLQSTILLDATYNHLANANQPLKHNIEVKMFVGSAEVIARTRVIGSRQINPGSHGFLQLALGQPVCVSRDDRFILRRPSPGLTIGGGVVLDPQPGKQHRRFRPNVISRFETLAKGTYTDFIYHFIKSNEPVAERDVVEFGRQDSEDIDKTLAELKERGEIVNFQGVVMTKDGYDRLCDRLLKIVESYHRQFPLRTGIPKEEVRSRLRLDQDVSNELIKNTSKDKLVVDSGIVLSLPSHVVRFSEAQQKKLDSLFSLFSTQGVNSPSVKEVKEIVGSEIYYALLERRDLVQLNDEVIYRREFCSELEARIVDYIKYNQRITVAELRDLLKTSRKYAIALLEYLDDLKVTRRVGDYRELVTRPINVQ